MLLPFSSSFTVTRSGSASSPSQRFTTGISPALSSWLAWAGKEPASSRKAMNTQTKLIRSRLAPVWMFILYLQCLIYIRILCQ